MQKKIIVIFILLFCFSCNTSRMADGPIEEEDFYSKNTNNTTETYIDKYKDLAIWGMRKYGIPASITMAQAILESASGNSELARHAKNHFGIKCTNNWNGKTYLKDAEKRNECFRRYNNESESFRDHAEFLQRDRYSKLFRLNPRDYKGWARGLKKAGYATNPKYATLLIGLIERYQLYNLDKKHKAKHYVSNDIYD